MRRRCSSWFLPASPLATRSAALATEKMAVFALVRETPTWKNELAEVMVIPEEPELAGPAVGIPASSYGGSSCGAEQKENLELLGKVMPRC